MVGKVLWLVVCLMLPQALFSWEMSHFKINDNETVCCKSTVVDLALQGDFKALMKFEHLDDEAQSLLLNEVDRKVLGLIFAEKNIEMRSVETEVRKFCSSCPSFSSQAKLWGDSIMETIRGRIRQYGVPYRKKKTPIGKLIPLTAEQEGVVPRHRGGPTPAEVAAAEAELSDSDIDGDEAPSLVPVDQGMHSAPISSSPTSLPGLVGDEDDDELVPVEGNADQGVAFVNLEALNSPPTIDDVFPGGDDVD